MGTLKRNDLGIVYSQGNVAVSKKSSNLLTWGVSIYSGLDQGLH